MKLKHAEILVEAIAMGLPEQIPSQREPYRRFHQKIEKIWEPFFAWAEWIRTTTIME